MNQHEILEEWAQEKLGNKSNYRLAESCLIEHEFSGQIGHPSSYARVKMQCEPADEL